jgi:hypothetical protein
MCPFKCTSKHIGIAYSFVTIDPPCCLQLYGEGDGLSRNCLGFIGDSESANKRALKDLEEQFPFLVNLVCQAHGLNNLIKVAQRSPNR